MNVTRAVIPVAGLATRMQPVARAIPKELLPLGRRPVLHHVVVELAQAGVRDFAIVTHPRTAAVEQYFGVQPLLDDELVRKGRTAGWYGAERAELREVLAACRFAFVRQEQPRGIADALHRARDILRDEPFFVHMGDSVVTGDEQLLPRMVAEHEKHEALCCVAVHDMDPDMVGEHATIVPSGSATGASFGVERIVEKPTREAVVVPLGVVGRYLLSLPMLAEAAGPAPDHSPLGCLGPLFPEGHVFEGRLRAVPTIEGAIVHDGGTLDGYLKAQRFFAASV